MDSNVARVYALQTSSEEGRSIRDIAVNKIKSSAKIDILSSFATIINGSNHSTACALVESKLYIATTGPLVIVEFARTLFDQMMKLTTVRTIDEFKRRSQMEILKKVLKWNRSAIPTIRFTKQMCQHWKNKGVDIDLFCDDDASQMNSTLLYYYILCIDEVYHDHFRSDDEAQRNLVRTLKPTLTLLWHFRRIIINMVRARLKGIRDFDDIQEIVPVTVASIDCDSYNTSSGIHMDNNVEFENWLQSFAIVPPLRTPEEELHLLFERQRHTSKAEVHSTVALVTYLMEKGITRAAIGTSKHECAMCIAFLDLLKVHAIGCYTLPHHRKVGRHYRWGFPVPPSNHEHQWEKLAEWMANWFLAYLDD